LSPSACRRGFGTTIRPAASSVALMGQRMPWEWQSSNQLGGHRQSTHSCLVPAMAGARARSTRCGREHVAPWKVPSDGVGR
jgi:hypothetical protein